MRYAYAYKGWNVYLDGAKLGGINTIDLPIVGFDADGRPISRSTAEYDAKCTLKFFTASEDYFALLKALGSTLTIKSAVLEMDFATHKIDTHPEQISGVIVSTLAQKMTRIIMITRVLSTDDENVTLSCTVSNQIDDGLISTHHQEDSLRHGGDWEACVKDFHDELSNRALALQLPASE